MFSVVSLVYVTKWHDVENYCNFLFPGITHIPDKISRCHIVHWVTHSHINANKLDLQKNTN